MTHARRCWLTLVALLALAILWAPHAAAQTVAKTQFIEAKRRYDRGQYEDALTLFRYAWEQSQSPNARLYVARCLGKLGKDIEAYEEFRAALRAATEKAAEDDKYLTTRDAAAAEMVVLEPRIGRLVVVVDESAAGAQVTLNGQPLAQERWGDIVPVAPGTQTVVAKAAGKTDVVRKVDVAQGQLASVGLWFAAEPKSDPQTREDAPSSPPPRESADTGEGLTGVQIYGVVMLGVGVTAMGVSAAFGAAAASKYGTLDAMCEGERCSDPAYADVVDSGKAWELASYITLGAGAGVALIGGAFLLFGGESDSSEQARLVPLPGGGLVTYQAAF